MKKLTVSLFIAILSIFILISPALAGSKQRHRWEGVAIGIGAAILGSAILGRSGYSHPAPVYTRRPPRPCRTVSRTPGHWESKKVWIPGRCERIWRGGHYDNYGRWYPGYWEEHRTSGFFMEKQVWVTGNCY